MSSKTFTCGLCSQTFLKGWSDEDADREYQHLFPEESAKQEAREQVCDDCFQKIAPRRVQHYLHTLTPLGY